MTKTTRFFAVALSLTASALAGYAQTGEEIIAKHIDAIGGEKAWSKIKSVKMAGSTNVQGMDVNMEILIQDQKAMRNNISLMGMDGYVILTEKGGWMYMPFQPGMDKVTPMPEDQLKGIKSTFSIRNTYLADKSFIKSCKYTGTDTLDGTACLKVEVTDKDDNNRTAYFDTKTYYMVRVEAMVKKGDEEMEVATTYGNFQKQDGGVVMPMSQTIPSMGGDVVFKKIDINPTFPESTFVPTEPAKDETKK